MTRVALLWHMHQPFYQDLATGEHVLPWVRLHALKDYWGMVAMLREFPGVRMTFNLVPSLLVQLEAFARGEARDRHLHVGLEPAASLSDEDRAFCLESYFHAHRSRMIEPYPRYAELLDRRGETGPGFDPGAQARFSVDDIRDLQVWHKLAWIDPIYHERDERVRRLVSKGRDFSEDDKQTLRTVELELLNRVVPEYREAAARGQVELSTSPFYHPILPLLCDTDVHLRAKPGSRMPRERFRHPEDAAEQLARAAALHERLFGRAAAGLWPSEGSVSDEIVPLVAGAGFRWMATDEEILARSLGRRFSRDAESHSEQPELLYRPYRVGPPGRAVACGFRDHTLSDLIGFSYASWPADAAAEDFVSRLAAAGRRYRERAGGAEATIFVILDGENAWEHFEGQGRPFLRALYSRLSSSGELATVTMSDACDSATERLPSIFPGSWIDGDFSIWIGHPDDHRAWTQLAIARRALDMPAAGADAEAVARAREEMLIAEGSDWFWWYGDDHSSEHDAAFDDLFRRHVRNVYQALGRPIPEDLFVSNITTAPAGGAILKPTGFIQPVLDGEVTSYFEWIGAGCVDVAPVAGAMHQATPAAPGITLVEYGFDLQSLFVRVDATYGAARLLEDGGELAIRFVTPDGVRIRIRPLAGAAEISVLRRTGSGTWTAAPAPAGLRAHVATVAEVEVPFAMMGASTGDPVAFFVTRTKGGVEVEQHPNGRPIELEVPDRHFPALNWTA